MGGWKLEVAKMAMYVTFPVGLFYYFNQATNFEDWVTKVKQQTFPREDPKHREMLEKAIQDNYKQHDALRLKALEQRSN